MIAIQLAVSKVLLITLKDVISARDETKHIYT